MDRIPRRRFSGISKRTIKLFHVSNKEAAEAKRLEKKYQVDNEHLKPVGRKEPVMEEKLGFDYHIVDTKGNKLSSTFVSIITRLLLATTTHSYYL